MASISHDGGGYGNALPSLMLCSNNKTSTRSAKRWIDDAPGNRIAHTRLRNPAQTFFGTGIHARKKVSYKGRFWHTSNENEFIRQTMISWSAFSYNSSIIPSTRRWLSILLFY